MHDSQMKALGPDTRPRTSERGLLQKPQASELGGGGGSVGVGAASTRGVRGLGVSTGASAFAMHVAQQGTKEDTGRSLWQAGHSVVVLRRSHLSP